MELLRAATLTVRDVRATAARYAEWLEYRTVDSGTVAVELAQSWGCPESALRPYATLQPASGLPVFIRIVEGDPIADYRALRTYGWSTIELCVSDVLGVQERISRSPFRIEGPAQKNASLPTIFPMQVRGPDDEIVYLTEILSDLPQYDLPRAKSLIDRVFIMVLGCSDMRASGRWFETNLGLSRGRDIDIDYTMLAKAFGTPPGQKYTICTMTHGRDVFLELDQYPVQAKPRPKSHGALPPGIAIASFRCPDFDGIARDWIVPPAKRNGPIYDGARAGTVQAPDGTLVEIIEAG
jgi:catechol 2,3-dioxygenase-like lactoylglutathione lyase family enzyme